MEWQPVTHSAQGYVARKKRAYYCLTSKGIEVVYYTGNSAKNVTWEYYTERDLRKRIKRVGIDSVPSWFVAWNRTQAWLSEPVQEMHELPPLQRVTDIFDMPFTDEGDTAFKQALEGMYPSDESNQEKRAA